MLAEDEEVGDLCYVVSFALIVGSRELQGSKYLLGISPWCTAGSGLVWGWLLSVRHVDGLVMGLQNVE